MMPAAILAFFPNQTEIARVLFEKRFIEVELRLNRAFDFRRGRFALAIERSAGGEVNQTEGEKADHQEQRYQHDQTFQEIHCFRSTNMSASRLMPGRYRVA